ncbi:MAG: D-tyrosyl-tRNA(Tyr) deacylase [Candidatus Magasanikbacteria bacterium]|jgi:D-aminoacyl-tRNA deacylase|nr:D-tyrosyl-tRNA(Tyr) deacylase [Candidatus Magasanikbacteria bacterium]MBT4071790.1 D-tyrosyl-tRNA(Tyr) deacylase [Candidatus Magasanikbacteria bacterium]
MRIVLQKVKRGMVDIDGQTIAQIADGYVLLLAIHKNDTTVDADKLVEKVLKLRLFAPVGSDSFMEQNIIEWGGSLIIVSQFTLYGDCKKGTRPSFTDSARPEKAKELYKYVVDSFIEKGIHVEVGAFGEHMEVELINDGPITLILDS